MIDINDLTLKQINELKNIFQFNEKKDICSDWIGRYVIVRTYSAGVHCGTLSKKLNNEVILTNARRIWSWSGAFTLSKIAESGLSKSSRLSAIISEIKLTEIEIIPCSKKSADQLTNIKEYIPVIEEIDGDGSGDGSGSGDDDGDGDGSGSGSGDGDGHGSGFGSGDGDGDCYDNGSGYGGGSGDDDGDGDGSGSGSGDGKGDGDGRG